jgi:hypothetical protein
MHTTREVTPFQQAVVAVMAAMPLHKQAEILDFARFLATRPETLAEIDWRPLSADEITLASAAAMQDWLSPEEDQAWAHLATRQ